MVLVTAGKPWGRLGHERLRSPQFVSLGFFVCLHAHSFISHTDYNDNKKSRASAHVPDGMPAKHQENVPALGRRGDRAWRAAPGEGALGGIYFSGQGARMGGGKNHMVR